VVEGDDSIVGGGEGTLNAGTRAGVVPVAATDNNGVRADIVTREPKVVERERAVVLVDELVEVRGDTRVEANTVSRIAAEIISKVAERSVELVEDDCLGLNFTDRLGDNALGHLLEDDEALLDDLDLLGVAYDVVLRLNHLFEVNGSIKVVPAVEVVKVTKRGVTTPVVERVETTSRQVCRSSGSEISGAGVGNGSRQHSGDESAKGNELGKCSEHDDFLNEGSCKLFGM